MGHSLLDCLNRRAPMIAAIVAFFVVSGFALGVLAFWLCSAGYFVPPLGLSCQVFAILLGLGWAAVSLPFVVAILIECAKTGHAIDGGIAKLHPGEQGTTCEEARARQRAAQAAYDAARASRDAAQAAANAARAVSSAASAAVGAAAAFVAASAFNPGLLPGALAALAAAVVAQGVAAARQGAAEGALAAAQAALAAAVAELAFANALVLEKCGVDLVPDVPVVTPPTTRTPTVDTRRPG